MNRKELVSMLTKLYPAVATKAILEDYLCFRLTDSSIRATDGLVQIELKTDKFAGLDTAIPAKRFFTLLSGLTDDDITLEKTGDELKVKAGRVKGTFKLQAESGALDSLDFDVEEWQPVPEGLLRGLRACSFAVSRDASRGVMCGINVNGNACVATDSIRIVRDTGETTYTETPVIVPPRIVKLLDKYGSEIDGWAVKRDVVYFKVGDVVIGGKCLLGDYPPVEDFLKVELPSVVKFPDGVEQAVDLHCKMLADDPDDDKEVKLTFAGNKLMMSSGDAACEFTQEFDLAEEVGEMSFSVHPTLLGDALARSAEMKFEVGKPWVGFTSNTLECLVCVELGEKKEAE